MSKSLPANLDIGKDGLRRQPLGIKLIFSEYVAIYFYHCVTLDLSIMAVHVFFIESSMGYLNIDVVLRAQWIQFAPLIVQ